MEAGVKVNDSNFEETVIRRSEEIPVVVDFWAEWCMPCRILSPVLEKLAREFNGKFVLAKANGGRKPKNEPEIQGYEHTLCKNV